MPKKSQSKLFRYGGAVAIVVLATAVRMVLDPVLGDKRPLVTFLFAIMFSAWAFGSGPTLLSLVLSLSSAMYFFFSPRNSFAIDSPADQVSLLIFLAFGLVTVLFSEQLFRARERGEWRQRQRESEQALLDSERRFRQLADAMPQMVWTISSDGQADYYNERWFEYTGLPRGSNGVASWAAALHPDDAGPAQAAWHQAVAAEQTYQVECRVKDRRTGAYRWHLSRAIAVRDEKAKIVQWFGTSTDIDDQKRVEEKLDRRVKERTLELTKVNQDLCREIEERRLVEAKLREQAEEIETLMEVLPVPIWIARDPECRRMTGNLATYELTRLPLGANASKTALFEEMPTTYRACRNGQEVPAEELPMQRAAVTGKEVRNAELDLVFADGSIRSIYGFAAPLFAQGGRVRGCVGAFIDITERKRLENSLRESEERFQAFMDHLPAGAWILDDQSRCLFVNRFYSNMTGLDRGCIVGKTAYDLYPPEIAVQYQANDRLALEVGSGLEREEPYIRPDGTPGELLVVKFPIRERDNQLRIGGVAIDVTDRKRAEDRMRRLAAQLASAEDTERRRLATDLHDSIGQSLSLLKLNLEPLARQAASDSNGQRGFTTSLQLLDNIIKQTRTLMFELYPSMLYDLGLVPTLLWYSEQLAPQAQVTVTEVGKAQPVPLPLASYLFRAAKELLGNALRHGGAHEIIVAVHWRGEVLKIVIDDDGCGFDPVKVLSPKTQRGLGLAGIQERLASFSGRMHIESDPGRGTRIIMEIPLAAGAESAKE
jgi:PAS domain S-box-containing protein